MIKNVLLLTKISTKNILENLKIFDKKEKKINKKSIYVWFIFIVIIAIAYLSKEILDILKDYGQEYIFLDALFVIIMIIMFMQSIISCMNILYFSKDIENFLIFPIKPRELLLSRIHTLLNILYITECIFLVIPLILYGTATMAGYAYYFSIILVFLLLPIFPAIFVNIVFLIVLKIKKGIKNKNIFQSVMTLIFISIIILFEVIFIKSIISTNGNYEEIGVNTDNILQHINQTMIIVNPIINILEQNQVFINILKVIGVYAIMYSILLIIGNKVYIQNILKTREYYKRKEKKIINLEKTCKQQKVFKAYIKNDLKSLYGNTTFFMQMVYPIFVIITTIMIFSITFRFVSMAKNQELYDLISNLNLNLEGVCIAIGIAQIIYSFSNISITAISRQGKNAVFMKYIPINLYKQFVLKNIPQFLVNILISIILVLAIKIIFMAVSWIQIAEILLICMVVGMLNSYLMLIVDIKKPQINWSTELEVFKQNSNKIFQYVWTIEVVLLLMYIKNIFENININIAMLIIFLFFTAIILILDRYARVQIKKNKLFKNII